MTSLKLAILDLLRRPLSSFIACVSIALSIATAGLLLRLSHLAERRYSTLETGAEVLVGAKSGDLDILLGALNAEVSHDTQTGYLPLKLYESLKAQASVKFEDGTETQPNFIRTVTPFVYSGFLNGHPAVGTDDSILRRGVQVGDGEFPSQLAELAVGSRLASENSLRVGQIVNVDPLPDPQGAGKSLPFKITAVMAPTGRAWDAQAWMTLASARVLLTHTRLQNSIWHEDVLNYFLIDLAPGASSFDQLKALVNDRTVGQAVSVERARNRLQELTGTGRALGLTIVVLVLLMAVFSLASVLITRFESLALQLAVLRAIGYSRAELARWLLLEGLLLGVAACLVGAALDAAAFPALRSMLAASLPATGSSSILESAPIWIAALVATVIAVAIPIVRAYSQDVHSALRA